MSSRDETSDVPDPASTLARVTEEEIREAVRERVSIRWQPEFEKPAPMPPSWNETPMPAIADPSYAPIDQPTGPPVSSVPFDFPSDLGDDELTASSTGHVSDRRRNLGAMMVGGLILATVLGVALGLLLR